VLGAQEGVKKTGGGDNLRGTEKGRAIAPVSFGFRLWREGTAGRERKTCLVWHIVINEDVTMVSWTSQYSNLDSRKGL